MANLNLSAFKYPIGFIRVIEFLFIVIAIAAVNSWSVTLTYGCPNSNSTEVYSGKAATFTLTNVELPSCEDDLNSKKTLWTDEYNAGGSAGFFYFVNVAALIYVLVITFIYVVFWDLYQNEKKFALVDLGMTALFFVLFFFSSSIWWAGANTIGKATSEDTVTFLLTENKDFWNEGSSTLERDTNNGKLTISVLCDWVCVLAFAFNSWFVWKEVVPRQAENPSQIA